MLVLAGSLTWERLISRVRPGLRASASAVPLGAASAPALLARPAAPATAPPAAARRGRLRMFDVTLRIRARRICCQVPRSHIAVVLRATQDPVASVPGVAGLSARADRRGAALKFASPAGNPAPARGTSAGRAATNR